MQCFSLERLPRSTENVCTPPFQGREKFTQVVKLPPPFKEMLFLAKMQEPSQAVYIYIQPIILSQEFVSKLKTMKDLKPIKTF